MIPIWYEKFDHPKYKYRLTRHYVYESEIAATINFAQKDIVKATGGYLNVVGTKLIIGEGYAWDGPSGPSIDTKDFMRGSLVHDALYQLLREGVIDHEREAFRKWSDAELYNICVEDGMPRWRAWYVWLAVRLFGGPAAGMDER